MERVRPVGQSAGAQRFRQVLEALPVPVAVVEGGAGQWVVTLANAALRARLPVVAAAEGVPLPRVVAGEPVAVLGDGSGPRPLDEVLAGVQASGRAVTEELLLPERSVTDGEVGAAMWSVSIVPMAEAGGAVWGLLLSFADPAAPGLGDGASALHDLARGLRADKPPEQIHADVLAAAVATAHAGRGVILTSEGGPAFAVAASTPGTGLAGTLEVEDRASAVWQTALGQRRLQVEDGGLPMEPGQGWDRALAVGIPLRGRRAALLAVAEPQSGTFDEGALDRIQLVAELASTALDNARLVDSLARLEHFLRGAVQASAALADSSEPAVVTQRLLFRLVEDAGLAGAALWMPRESDDVLELRGSAGLPEEIRRRVALLPPTSVAARLLRAGTAAHASAAPSSWGGHLVRLVTVPQPLHGVLGVYAERPLPDLVDGVLATLAHALASAIRQATLHKRARTVVNSLVRELRPNAITLPEGLSVGTVYRSATAGVDVGGDFFDLFRLADGRIGVACGDVSGKGVEAASLTAMAVYSLRAYALADGRPDVLVPRLNRAVYDQTTDERFMTMVYLRIDPAVWTLELTVAGHPPPLLVSSDGAAVLEVTPDVPIGIAEQEGYSQREMRLDAGTSLVLYTDGVTEARRDGAPDGALLGIEGLLEAVRAWSPSLDGGAQELADAIDSAVTGWTSGGTSDDTAIVVVRREQPGEEGTTLLTTPAGPR